MARDRFELILQFLHLNNNADDVPRDHPRHDLLFKIRPISEMFIANWQQFYALDREISIDEQMIAFKGKTDKLQFMPNKPHKWGLKAWTLAEAKSGYVYNWDLYSGKRQGPAQHGLTYDVVMNLIDPLVNRGHHLYTDNFYTAPDLYHDLTNLGVGACGTLRKNRVGTPEIIKDTLPKKDEPPIIAQDNNMTFIGWCDKRPVYILTTIFNGNTFLKDVRVRNGPPRMVVKPIAVELYTKYMGGVDRADQLISYYLHLHRSLKWWKKIFFHLLETSFWNSYIIYKASVDKPLSSGKYRLQIVHGLVDGHERQNNRVGRRPADMPNRLLARHFVGVNIRRTAAGRVSTPDCIVCSDRDRGRRVQTQYVCVQCDLPMCCAPCHQRYHTIVNYR